MSSAGCNNDDPGKPVSDSSGHHMRDAQAPTASGQTTLYDDYFISNINHNLQIVNGAGDHASYDYHQDAGDLYGHLLTLKPTEQGLTGARSKEKSA